jgi:hypothetical protein
MMGLFVLQLPSFSRGVCSYEMAPNGLNAPKDSGCTLSKEGCGIDSSIAVWQDISDKAKEKATAPGVAIGSGYIYETTTSRKRSTLTCMVSAAW